MPKKPTYKTAVGRARFVHLNKPDTAFDTDNPKFKTELIMSAKDAQPLIDSMNKEAAAVHGKGTFKLPIMKDEDTGEVIFKLASKFQPKFNDTTGKTIAPSKLPNIGGGSNLKCGGVMNIYDVMNVQGVALMLDSVQIIDIVEFGSGTQFDAVEGGSFQVDDDAPAVNGAVAGSTSAALKDDVKFDF